MKILSLILPVLILNCSAMAFEWESRTILHRGVYSNVLLYEDSLMEMSDEGLSYTISDTLGAIYRNSIIHYDTIGVTTFRSPLVDRWQNVISTPRWSNVAHPSCFYRLSLDDTSFVEDRRYRIDIPWSYRISAAQPMADGDEMILYGSSGYNVGAYFAARITSTGEVVWSYEIMSSPEGHEIKEMRGITPDSEDDSCFYYFGSRCSDAPDFQYFTCITKIDVSGNVVWTRDYAWGRPGEVFGMDYTAMHPFSDGSYAVVGTRQFEIRYLHIDTNGDSIACFDYNGGSIFAQSMVSLALRDDRILMLLTYEHEEELRVGLLYINSDGDSLDGYYFPHEGVAFAGYGPLLERSDGKVLFWIAGRDERERGSDILYSFYPAGRPDVEVEVESYWQPSTADILAYPNPFNSTTMISFDLDQTSLMDVGVFDIAGRRIATLANSQFEAGQHRLVWNAEAVPTGIYFVKAVSSSGVRTSRMALVR